MSKVSPITKSPVAEYLLANKAKPVRDGSMCRFYSPSGSYLGTQEKQVINGVKFFTTSIYGENFQPLFSKSVVMTSVMELFKDKNLKKVCPICISMAKKVFSIDFLTNKFNMVLTEKVLQNEIHLIARDTYTGIGLHYAERPYKYDEKVVEVQKDMPLAKNIAKSHFSIN